MAIDVANQSEWNTAVAAVAAAGTGSTTTINIVSGFTLTSSLAQIQASNTNVTVIVTGNNQAINGASSFQGIQVNGANAPTVKISNLLVTNTTAVGGNGQNGQNGYYSAGLSYGSGGGGGGGLGAGGGLLVGSGANVTLTSVTFTGNTAQGGTGGNGGSAQNAAPDPVNGGYGGAGGAANNGGASGGGGAGGTGGHAGGQGTLGTNGVSLGDAGGGGGGSGTTSRTSYTANNAGGLGNSLGGGGGGGGDGVTNNNGSQGPGADGGFGGNGGAARGGAIYVATGGTLTILDTPIAGATTTGGAGGNAGVGQGPSHFNGISGSPGTGLGGAIFINGVTANVGVSTGTVTYANSISGTGLNSGGVTTAINKTGAGTLVLSAANDFSGNVNIAAGTLSIAATGNLGNATNGVVMSDVAALAVTGTTTLASGHAFKIAGSSMIDVAAGTTTALQGVIADGGSTGSLVKSGDGTLLLSATNIYSGSTTVNAGTLLVGSANAIPSGTALTVGATGSFDMNGFTGVFGSLAGAGTVTNGGVSAVALTTGGNNADSTFSGSLPDGASAISLTKTGTGTLTLSGVNNYSGATTINGGTLSVASDANLGAASSGVTLNGGTLQFGGAFTTARAFTIGGSGGAIDTQSYTPILSGTIAGTGALTKAGGGTLTIAGDGSAYTGALTVAAGTLTVGSDAAPNGSLGGSVIVDNGASLSGFGSIGGLTNNGTVRPGGSIGTLTVNGNYAQASNGTLTIEVSPTASSTLLVHGTATLGGKLVLLFDPGVYTSHTYTFLSASSVSGSFAQVTDSGNPPSLAQAINLAAAAGQIVLSPSGSVVAAPTNDTTYSAVSSALVLNGQRMNGILLDRLGNRDGDIADGPAGGDRRLCARLDQQFA